MARAAFKHYVKDQSGAAIQNAAVFLYEVGTTTPVSDAFDAAESGSLVTFLLSNDQGEVSCWFTTPREIDVFITSNSTTAFYPATPTSAIGFDSFTETVPVYPPPGEIALAANLTAHVDDAVEAHTASAIAFSPAGIIAATDVQAALEEVAAEAGSSHTHSAAATSVVPFSSIEATDVQAALEEIVAEVAGSVSAPPDATFLVTTANAGLSDEVVVGATPQGELGGTWDNITVDDTHSGSAHDDFIAKAFLDTKGDLILASAADTPVILPVGSTNQVLTADSSETSGAKWAAPAAANVTSTATGRIAATNVDSAIAELASEMSEEVHVFSYPGTLTVGAGVGRLRLPYAYTVLGVSAAINTAPTGASVIVDVNKNGTTLFTTQADRPTIAVSTFGVNETVPAVTSVAAYDEIRMDRDQVGSTVAGADLTVFMRIRRTS